MHIATILLNWYFSYKRDLPWRKNKDPYIIWISEIIMQQTRINQGTGYFLRFTDKYPNISTLANADLNDVLLVWQGLGYYSRARNLHTTSLKINNELGGVFPSSYKELIKLKGIGEYTAAAIASFCFNEKIPAIDGNVYRVISRLFDIEQPIDKAAGKNKIKQACYEIISETEPGDFNQAMMDFGSMICTPKNPSCTSCPFNSICLALKNNTISIRPVKSLKTKQRIRHFTYLYISDGESTLIEQRKGKDIWEGLYQLPLIETEKEININELKEHSLFKSLNKQTCEIKILKLKPHILSHQKIHTNIIRCRVNEIETSVYKKIHINELVNYPFPVLLSKSILFDN